MTERQYYIGDMGGWMLQATANGLIYKDVARALGVNRVAVVNHLGQVYADLGIDYNRSHVSRTRAIAMAAAGGLLKASDLTPPGEVFVATMQPDENSRIGYTRSIIENRYEPQEVVVPPLTAAQRFETEVLPIQRSILSAAHLGMSYPQMSNIHGLPSRGMSTNYMTVLFECLGVNNIAHALAHAIFQKVIDIHPDILDPQKKLMPQIYTESVTMSLAPAA